MKFLSLLTAAVVVYAKPQYNTENTHEWLAPGPNDCKSAES